MSEAGTTTTSARWLGRVAIGVALAGIYLPVVMTLIYSFNASRIGTVWTGFSLGGYGELLHQSALWRALARAAAIAVGASTISVVAGTMPRRWVSTAGGRGAAMAQSRARSAARDAGCHHRPFAGHVLQCAAAAARLGHGGCRPLRLWHLVCLRGHGRRGATTSMRRSTWQRSTAGRLPWQAYRTRDPAVLAPSLVVAWLFVFALSFDDFLITFMTKGPGNDTLPIKIYAQMRFGIKPQTSALFIVAVCRDAGRGDRCHAG